jgi:hypothetical protein
VGFAGLYNSHADGSWRFVHPMDNPENCQFEIHAHRAGSYDPKFDPGDHVDKHPWRWWGTFSFEQTLHLISCASQHKNVLAQP